MENKNESGTICSEQCPGVLILSDAIVAKMLPWREKDREGLEEHPALAVVGSFWNTKKPICWKISEPSEHHQIHVNLPRHNFDLEGKTAKISKSTIFTDGKG